MHEALEFMEALVYFVLLFGFGVFVGSRGDSESLPVWRVVLSCTLVSAGALLMVLSPIHLTIIEINRIMDALGWSRGFGFPLALLGMALAVTALLSWIVKTADEEMPES